jgi:type 1 glutamine amidotransferase
VLIAGDEEYRSEEYMPVLGKILAERHGFRATVLFPVDKATGQINPKTLDNIPGLEALDSADLMIIGTRFRALPDEQMKHVDDYLKAGKPVIGMRTATHAFNGLKTPYDVYNNGYKGEKKEWADGFGRLVLGERWVSHHGEHKKESTRAMIAPEGKGSPLLNGIKDGEIWTPTDVYGVRLPLPGDSKPLLLGQVVKRSAAGEPVAGDPFYGMSPDDREPAAPKLDKKTNQTLDKNNPMMPVAWTKSYQLPGGKPGKAFATTMGSAADVTNEGLRRLIVNAAYSLTGLAVPERADVGIVGEFKPTAFGFNGFKAGMKPGDFQK